MLRVGVTVIIPCYNTARYVCEAVSCVLDQTYVPVRVIVINDGSTDDFGRAIAPFRSRITVLEQPNSGQAAARNLGLAHVDTELIAFLDADDRWVPDKIERQLQFLAIHPEVGLVHTAVTAIDARGERSDIALRQDRVLASGHCLVDLTTANRIAASSVLLRTQALGADRFSLGIDGVEDWDLWLRLAQRHQFGFIDAPLTQYRFHGANMSLASAERMLRGSIEVLGRLLQRDSAPDVVAAARRHRRELQRALGHLAYDRADMPSARVQFAAAFPAWRGSEALRWSATFLPESTRGLARSAWRHLRRGHVA